MKRQRGFTLLELMIVVVVIAVLAGLALSGYQKQIRKSRRAEAKEVISDLTLKEEKYRSNNTTFAATAASVGGAMTSNYYTITLSGASASGYTVTATPTGDQAKDSCGTLAAQMLNTGVLNKTPTTPGCWQ
jgi:type IV pilus assembly protein PilE